MDHLAIAAAVYYFGNSWEPLRPCSYIIHSARGKMLLGDAANHTVAVYLLAAQLCRPRDGDPGSTSLTGTPRLSRSLPFAAPEMVIRGSRRP